MVKYLYITTDFKYQQLQFNHVSDTDSASSLAHVDLFFAQENEFCNSFDTL